MADASYTFYQAGEPVLAVERDLPVNIKSTGHELRASRAYRWNNERHAYARSNIMQYTLSGWGCFESERDGRRLLERVGPGRMFIACWDRGFEYRCEGAAPWEFLWISLSGSFADRVARTLAEPSPVIDLPTDSPPVRFLRGLQERLAGSYPMDRFTLTGLGYEFLVQLLREKSREGTGPEDRFAMEARAFVTRHIRTASVGSLARHFGYGEKYFNEYFKRCAATTPNRFIVEQRLRYAASLLANTRKKIEAVAEEAGFADGNYFSKVFKRYRGLPPAEYRARNKDVIPVSEIVVL